jgi:hypothetical protein
LIISHEHKFIFVKTAETAGTSMEIALSPFCGARDVVTRIRPRDEEVRASLGYPGPQNSYATASEYGLRDMARLALRGRRRERFLNHSPLADVRAWLDADRFGEYFKFCIERNPWDKTLSWHRWNTRLSSGQPPLSTFVASPMLELLRAKGLGLYTLEGEVGVDTIYRYEELDDAVSDLQRRLNLPSKPLLPHTKVTTRANTPHYREVLSERDAERIAQVFAREIELLGYTF